MGMPPQFQAELRRYASATNHHCLSLLQIKRFLELEEELLPLLAQRVREQAMECPSCRILLNPLGRLGAG